LFVGDDFDVAGDAVIDLTCLVTGVLTTTAATVFNGGFASNAASTIATTDNTVNLTLTSTDADASGGPKMNFYRNSSSPAPGDILTQINHQGENDAGETVSYMYQNWRAAAVGDGTESGQFDINTYTAGTAYERLGIDPTETVFNQDSADVDFRVESDNLTHALFVQGSDGFVGVGVTAPSYPLEVQSGGVGTVLRAGTAFVSIDSVGSAASPSLIFNGDGDTGIWRAASDTLAVATGGTERMRIGSSGNVGIGTTAPTALLELASGAPTLTLNATSQATNKKKVRLAVSQFTSGDFHIQQMNDNGTTVALNAFTIKNGGNVGIGTTSPSSGYKLDVNGKIIISQGDAEIRFNAGGGWIGNASTANTVVIGTSGSERMRIDASGNVLVGKTASNFASAGIELLATDVVTITRSAATPLNVNRIGSSAGAAIIMHYNGSDVGSIDVAASSTSYNTSSDYRLKENVDYDWDATTRLKQLKPARFNFIVDETNTLVDGFLAHEVSSIVPEAITGTKDEVDDNGDAVMQGIDQSKLVPLLVKTIQELEARITALEG
jgi:hypothetical protein